MRLYYMTAAVWAEVILKERRLKLSRFHEANDPFELNLIDSRDQRCRKIVKMIQRHHDKSTGMICLTLGWNNPMMWAHYADKHKGVCLGFDIPDDLVSVVDYTDKKIKVEFGDHLPNHGLSVDLLDKVLRTKSKVWSFEEERRVVARLTTPDPENGLYYTDFGAQLTLRSVAIGHRCDWTPKKVANLIGKVNSSVKIWKVRPAFGRFDMVEHREVKSLTIYPSNKGNKQA